MCHSQKEQRERRGGVSKGWLMGRGKGEGVWRVDNANTGAHNANE